MSLPLSDPLAPAILDKSLNVQSNSVPAAVCEASVTETVSMTAPTTTELHSQIDLGSDLEDGSDVGDDSSNDDADSCCSKDEQDDIDYNNFKLTQRTISFPLCSGDDYAATLQVVVHQDLIGVEGTGGVVWSVCEHFCTLLVSQQRALQHQQQLQSMACDGERSKPWYDVRGRRVLELGCGPGLASFVCAALGADVIGTDGDVDAIRLARKSVPANNHLMRQAYCQGSSFCKDPQAPAEDSTTAEGNLTGRVQFQQFWWGRDDITRLGGRDSDYVPDVVIACDVMYDPKGVADFSATMRDVFAVNPNAVLVMALQRRRPELENVALREWVNEYEVHVVWHQGKYSAITIQRK